MADTFLNFTKKAFLMFGFLCLMACDQDRPVVVKSSLVLGITATSKALGYEFVEEVLEVDGNVSLWETRWKSQTVSKVKLYWGIYPLEVQEENIGYINEFDTSKVDDLFPLSVGGEVSFEGVTRQLGGVSEDTPIWVHMSVREKTEIKIKGGKRDVFIIDITTDKEGPAGVERSMRTLWFSEELGVSLKRETRTNNDVYVLRVLDLFIPDASQKGSERRRSLGTILI